MEYRSKEQIFPDEETLQAWEAMRIEILHELQEGACADVSDASLENISKVIVILKSLKAKRKPVKVTARKRTAGILQTKN